MHNATASNLDEDTLSELAAYEDEEADDFLGRAIRDANHDLDRGYYATDEGSDEDEESVVSEDSEEPGPRDGYYLDERNQGNGCCH